ncbi:MAG: DUF4846 domain-containing protein [Cyclobacteriaceae bacterium]|nr:DUF4846 domain-containing protein [Cyclobacteriaceae bacterium]
MSGKLFFTALLIGFALRTIPVSSQVSGTHPLYSWKSQYDPETILVNRIPVPSGFQRKPPAQNSFAYWLNNIPLKKGNPDILLYNGQKKNNQRAQHAVLDIDVGNKDLQQCADAVIRLRAEYLFATHQYDKIKFAFTNGFLCDYQKWAQGFRPKIEGNVVSWVKSAQPDTGYASFRKYLNTVFMYSGTQSLSQELRKKNVADISPGDVFIQGGFPGHAVIVMDVAVHPTRNEKLFLLAQSYMPAQDIHVLKNPSDSHLSPWFASILSGNLETPEWTFEWSDLKGF